MHECHGYNNQRWHAGSYSAGGVVEFFEFGVCGFRARGQEVQGWELCKGLRVEVSDGGCARVYMYENMYVRTEVLCRSREICVRTLT